MFNNRKLTSCGRNVNEVRKDKREQRKKKIKIESIVFVNFDISLGGFMRPRIRRTGVREAVRFCQN